MIDMTHATIYRTSRGEVRGFKIEGHSGYAEEGSDIVCASISMLSVNTLNALDMLTKARYEAQINEEIALYELMLTSSFKNKSKDIKALLGALQLGLCQIAAAYPEYVCITFKEV